MTAFQKILLLLSCILFALNGCSSLSGPTLSSAKPASVTSATGGGGYYQNDGPSDAVPSNIDNIPDAVPRLEALHKYANGPYTVLGKQYVPQKTILPFVQHGNASWYGRQFHGRKTSSGEVYDMFAMTAAHPTLPIPSYVKVTNKSNNQQAIVRVNDRGPFHAARVIDLSYSAAHRLGFIKQGSTPVIVEQIVFDSLGNPTNLQIIHEQPPIITTNKNPALSPIVVADTQEPGFFIQIGAYRVRENADTMKLNLLEQFGHLNNLTQIIIKQDLFRVWVGPFVSRHEAANIADQIYNRYGFKAVIVNQ